MQMWTARYALLTIIFVHTVSPAQPSLSTGRPSVKSEATQDADLELIKVRREWALIQARSFAADILEMKDISVKTFAIAALADLLWSSDEPYARQLFSKALKFTSVNHESSSGNSTLSASMLDAMRRQVIRRIARRDPALARRILDEELTTGGSGPASGRGAQREIEIASDLLKDLPEEAVKFAERSLGGSILVAPTTRLLKELRLKDEVAADALFLKTVSQVAADPDSKPNDLLLLGTYIFTSPRIDNSDYAAVAQVPVHGLSVYDITADRPNIAPSVTRAYLQAALEKLTRPTSDYRQRQYYYIASYFLLPKLRKFAPALAPRLAAAMQNLVPDIPRWLTQESSFDESPGAIRKSLDDELREIEKVPDVTERDVRYLMLGHRLWADNDFKGARACASKVSNGDARARLNALTEFREAAKEFDHPRLDVEGVERLLARLTGKTERALLWLGVARVRVSTNEPQRASEAVNEALKAARSVDGARRPYLILNAAGQLAGPDRAAAQQLLVEAVKGLNEQDEESLKGVEWQEWIKVGPIALEFPLTVTGVEFGLDAALKRLARDDTEGTVATVRSIKDEWRRAEAQVALTAVIFEQVAARKH